VYEKQEQLICDAPEKPGAKQISPILSYPGLTEPTVKHSCKRTIMAAAIRACTNRVHFDKDVLSDWRSWFRRVIIPEFLSALDKDGIRVSIETWLSKYPQKYQDSIRREMKTVDWEDHKPFVYESFPKIELQFTTVPVCLKDSEFNTVKERQISGPPTAKKIFANPFINALEKLAHNNIKNYCGMKDWPAICKTIEEQSAEVPDIVYGAADGSGFDMTQFREMHEMVNELIMACADHVNTEIEMPLTREHLMFALQDSLILDVSVARGAVRYKAEGRASGDGWTTFGNTVLMMSYWRYTFEKAGIKKFVLLVKGDDVLFGISKKHRQLLELWIRRLFATKQEFVCHGLGQICKFVKWGTLDEMDFLSNYFFYTDAGSVRMSRIPERVFQTMSWSTKIPFGLSERKEKEIARELCFSKGHSLLAWSRGLPIFEKYARKMIELGKKGKATEYNEYSDEARVWKAEDDRGAYISFLSARYSITEREILNIETAIDGLTDIYDELYVPEISAFFSNLEE
jgi:hypothetical protein